MHRNVFRLARGLAFAALALGMGGCWGKSQFDVAGLVKYNGAPLAKEGGQIVFVGPDGTQVAAPIGLDGAYRATKVTSGLNRVAVYYPNPQAAKSGKRLHGPRKQGEPLPPPPPPPPPPFWTPSSYASVDTSNLSVQVEKETVWDVHLTGPAIP